MFKKENFNNLPNWLAAVTAYVISTIMMAHGMGVMLEYGAAGESTTLTPEIAKGIGWALALLIQWLETKWILYPHRRDRYNTAMLAFLLLFDASAIFVGLNGHLNLVWMAQNGGDTAGMIMHGVALMGQLAGAIIGSFGAERLLEEASANHHGVYPNRAELAKERFLQNQGA